MKWSDDTDWGKLFTEGGEINETCTHSSGSPFHQPFNTDTRLAKVCAALVGA